ncbi:MAG: hypothetical protein RL095_682 [Verrucomicrobiota bacterium]|jgi:uncharacterized protein YciI
MSGLLLFLGVCSFACGALLYLKASQSPKYKFASAASMLSGSLLLLLRLIALDPNEESLEADRANYSLARQVEAEAVAAHLKTLFSSGKMQSLAIFGPEEFADSQSTGQSSLQIIREALGPDAAKIKFHKQSAKDVARLSQLSSIIDEISAGEGRLYIGGIEADIELDPGEMSILAENRRSQTWLCTASGNPKLQKSLFDAGIIDLVFKPVVTVGANKRVTCECQVFSRPLSAP